jgi:hypothetical protein
VWVSVALGDSVGVVLEVADGGAVVTVGIDSAPVQPTTAVSTNSTTTLDLQTIAMDLLLSPPYDMQSTFDAAFFDALPRILA